MIYLALTVRPSCSFHNPTCRWIQVQLGPPRWPYLVGLGASVPREPPNTVNIPPQPGVSWTYISGILLTLSLLKFSTPTLNSSMRFLKVLFTHLQ
jgi:hypothetical protein